MGKVAVIDLFAGAGGLSLGASAAGGDVRLLLELDPVCCETLRLNARVHGGDVLEEDVSKVDGKTLRRMAGVHRGDPLLVVGGAPCQPFSKAAYWTDPGDDARYRRARARGEKAERPRQPLPPRDDPRRSLVEEYWRIVEEVGAHAFVFENVPSLLHPRNRGELDFIQSAAHKAGFKTTLVVANAAEYGVAQRRVRVLLLGSKRRQPLAPSPTHSLEESAKGGLKRAKGAKAAIAAYAGSEFHEPEEVVTGRWAEHLRTVPPGWNYKAHTAWAGHPNPTFETETRFWSFLLKLHPELPSWTIAANPGPWVGPFHWDSRRLRTPELAALQGFPHGYHFAGTRRERVRQIGNAVPAPLAEPFIRAVLETLASRNRRRSAA